MYSEVNDFQFRNWLPSFGYDHFIIGDCWQAPQRNESGFLEQNSTLYPDEFHDLPTLIRHVKRTSKPFYPVKIGITSDSGKKTCYGGPGSLGYEQFDAELFASWGIDFLHYENCDGAEVPAKVKYTNMANALNSTGASIYFSVDNWGNEGITKWGPSIVQSWSTAKPMAIYPSQNNTW